MFSTFMLGSLIILLFYFFHKPLIVIMFSEEFLIENNELINLSLLLMALSLIAVFLCLHIANLIGGAFNKIIRVYFRSFSCIIHIFQPELQFLCKLVISNFLCITKYFCISFLVKNC